MIRPILCLLGLVFWTVGCSLQSNQAEPLELPANDIDEECQIPESFTSLQIPSGPALESTPAIEIRNQKLTIELEAGGQVSVKANIELVNRGSSHAVAKLGYLARVPEGLKPPIEGLEFNDDSEFIERKTCSFDSPRNLIRPHTDTADYVQVQIAPTDTTTVEISFRAKASPDGKPSTLFGYKDVFALNWKNWSWPYTKSPIFSEIADSLELYRGILSLGKASKTTAEIRVKSEGAEIRGLSHEQNLKEIESLKAFSWTFDRDNQPEAIEFEWLENANFANEIDVFSRLAKERPDDLRAHIHLANLYFLNGDHKSRVEVLTKLLANWEGSAEKQLLTRRNDVRPAAYVGLVKSLLVTGKLKEAKEEASKGATLITKLENDLEDSLPDHAKLSKLFLKKQSN